MSTDRESERESLADVERREANPMPRCDRCGRFEHVCQRDLESIEPRRRARVAACDALARVRSLARFRSTAPLAPPFLLTLPTVRGADGCERSVDLTVRTLALVREWRRLRASENLCLSLRIEAADAIALEIAERLSLDLGAIGIDLDATIGDDCPRCGRQKTDAEGAADYWCDACVAAARAEVE